MLSESLQRYSVMAIFTGFQFLSGSSIYSCWRSSIKSIAACPSKTKEMPTKLAARLPHFATFVVVIIGVAVVRQQTVAQRISIDATLPKLDVGIVVAVLSEYQALYQVLDLAPEPYNLTKFGRTFTIGSIAGHSVVMVACGIGMTNSAMTTQLLIDTFDVQYLLMQAGAK
ncbi:hypothetical protein Vretifemale_5493, partial [Volvox reticuliferus]